MKKLLLFLFAALAITTGWAKKVKTLPSAIRNYPSGMIDEYHFRPGYIVVEGSINNVPADKYGTIRITGQNLFTNQDFIKTMKVDSTGHFRASILVPHTQFFGLEPFGNAFVAVGDTLRVNVTGHSGTEEETVVYSGTGVTGEVNRIWPELYRWFFPDATADDKPWKAENKTVMLEWKKKKLDEFRHIVCAVDADTIGLLNGCSGYAKDVMKSCLLAHIPAKIGSVFGIYALRGRQRNMPPEQAIRLGEIWDFLHQCESYILDNPCILFSEDAEYLINTLEFGPLCAYMFLGNDIGRKSSSLDSDLMRNYKDNFVLPHDYDHKEHKDMLAYRQGKLLSVADYYQMATDSICARFQLHNNFMMQICLMHHALYKEEDIDVYTMAEQFAGTIPQFTDKIISHHAVDTYRNFVVDREGYRPEVSLSPEGDSLFNALVEKYKGNVIVMDFWGIGCAPCRAGMLKQREDVEYFKDKPVRYLYICNEKDSPRDMSEDFLNKNNIRGEHIYLAADEWNYLAEKFQFLGIPFCVLIDRKGNIVSHSRDVDRYMIEELLKQ